MKKDVKPIQQKARPVPIHFQNTVRKELEKLIERGHLEKEGWRTENGFVSPAVVFKKGYSADIPQKQTVLETTAIKCYNRSGPE